MIDKVNKIFNGNLEDSTPSRVNVNCRYAYVGYLHLKKLSRRKIAEQTGYKLSYVSNAVAKHKDLYQFDKAYKHNFHLLIFT